MRNFNFLTIISVIAFLGLAGFSCFWTAESLFIWQPSITLAGAWLIATVFYVIASLCFTIFLKSLSRNGDFHGKLGGQGGQFLLGFVGLLVFWLMISLPTNTHTLLYRASIKSVLTTDLTRTQNYLQSLKDNNVEIKKIDEEYKSKKDKVDALILRMVAEIDNPSYVGIGPRFKTILTELNQELGVQIQETPKVGTSRTQWLGAINYYQKQAYDQLKIVRADCDKRIAEVRRMMRSQVLDNLIKNCSIALKDVNKMKGVDNGIIEAAVEDLTQGYSFIKANARYVQFKEEDKYRYTREGAIPEAKEMLSVPDVWKDFLTTDKYDGHGFVWWVFIALLVDVAAFVFFNLSFSKDTNNAI